ncbi:MAG: metal ABC transporter ATP-binding protein [Akkermansia sp.]|nr:metal ABC transporter ATP-binding protein [Akkermansia sp.]
MVDAHDHICWGGGHHHHGGHDLSVHQLSARYGEVEALSGISFTATCGHTLALIGPNGAGKSTLLNLLAGLLRPSGGTMMWNNAPLHDTRYEIAYMPQRTEVNWQFPISVRELVEMGRYPATGLWRKLSRHDHEIVDKALEALNLTDLQKRQIGALSGGQQQRAFLARALAQEAHILLLDEPFTGLDVPGTESLATLLRSLAAEGRLIIASHHDLSTATRIFDYTLLLNRRPIAYGATAEVLSEANLFTAFGKRNITTTA